MNCMFRGFSTATLDFLHMLDTSNRKEWLEAHQEEYRHRFLIPFQQLADILTKQFGIIDPCLTTDSQQVMSCIHSNTCFSQNRQPQKTTMVLTFKQPRINWQDAPAFFFELSADTYCYGMGFENVSSQTMDWLRKIVVDNPDVFRHMIAFLAYQKTFSLAGDRHETLRKGGRANEPFEWCQRKNLYLVCNQKISRSLFSRQIVYELVTGFALLAPMYHLLWRLRTPELFSFHKYP